VADNMIIRRGLPILLAVASVALLAHGALFSRHPVTVEEEITPPAPPIEPPPPFMNRRPDGVQPPFMRPPPRPPAKPIKIEKTVFELEKNLVLEATRGGVERMADGRLRRTYSGAPPSGCPT
jgi:hypothetical protein